MITNLDHIALAVGDLDAASEAYEGLLGLPAERHHPLGGARRVWFRLENMSLELIGTAGDGPAGDRVRTRLADQGDGLLAIAFQVDDMDAARRLLERRGVASIGVEGSTLKAARLSEAATHGLALSVVEAPRPGPAGAGASPADSLNALDHVVIQTPNPDRTLALYGAKLGLDLRLDRSNPAWGARQMFFRCGANVVEIVHGLKDGVSDGPDQFGGLAWRTADPGAARERLARAGFNVSEVRKGRKPGTQVFTVRDRTFGVPTLVLGATND